jgi:hypothetical protein
MLGFISSSIDSFVDGTSSEEVGILEFGSGSGELGFLG